MGPAICVACISLVECDKEGTIALLFVAVSLQGAFYSGFMVNHQDIAPNYAGTLFGITNAAATIPSWVGPMTVGYLTTGQVISIKIFKKTPQKLQHKRFVYIFNI